MYSFIIKQKNILLSISMIFIIWIIVLLLTMLTSCSNITSNRANTTPTLNNRINTTYTKSSPKGNQTSSPSKSNVTESVIIDPKVVDDRKIVDLPKFPERIKNRDEILPAGWSMLDILENDFNNDGLIDIVGVVEHPFKEDEMYPRILFVYMNNGNGFNRNIVNQYLIRNRDEGGVMGDPYQELTAHKNTFTTHAFGGSAWKWNENYTFNYKDGEWFLLYKENIYGYGPYETSYSYDDYKVGVGKRRYTENSPDKENRSKLEFTVKLNKQPLLMDFAYNNCFTERIKAPEIKSLGYNEDIPHFKGNIPTLQASNISFHNKDYIVYMINQSNEVVFLGIYNYAKKHLQMIARYSIDDNGINIAGNDFKVYKNRLYFQEEITKLVDVRKDGEVKKQSEIVGVQLVSMNLNGSDKKVIFKADHNNYKKNEILDDYLEYLTLEYEITGDEIIVKVFCGDIYPYYRMSLDGVNKKMIGSVPKGEW